MKEEGKIYLENDGFLEGGIIVEKRLNLKILNREVQYMSEKEENEVRSVQEKWQWYLI